MRVYVSGPYTKGDVVLNVRRAIEAGNWLAAKGHVPFIPHLSHFWHMLFPQPYEFWMAQDMNWISACDAMVRLPGESSGADREVAAAKKLGMPVYDGVLKFLQSIN
jgi:hypothetical protein